MAQSNENFAGRLEDLNDSVQLQVYNETGSTIAAGSLVYISGYDNTQDAFNITLADADAAGKAATHILRSPLANNTAGLAYRTMRLTSQVTNGATEGDPVYSSATAGGITLTAPSAANSRVQVVGFVAVVHATAGIVEINLSAVPIQKLGANEVQANDNLVAFYNDTGGALTRDQLVYISGWNAANALPTVTLADADAGGKLAEFVLLADVADAASGQLISEGLSAATLNTNSFSAVGDPVYLSTTAGGFTHTDPGAATATTQVVGRVAVKSATVGQIYWHINRPIRKLAPNETVGTALVATTADAKGDLYVATAADTVTRKAVGADGTVLTANAGNTDGLEWGHDDRGLPAWYKAAGGTALAATDNPVITSASHTMVDGRVYFISLYLPYDATITGVGFIQNVQGDTTADNNNKIGLYTSDGTTLTLVASSADDGTLWESAAGVVQKAFSSTYAAQAGLYFVSALYNSSAEAAAPQIARPANMIQAAAMDILIPGFGAAYVAGADLPATQAWAGVTASASRPFFFVY